MTTGVLSKDLVERLVAMRGWEVRELPAVGGYRPRVVLKMDKHFDTSVGKTRYEYLRANGDTMEDAYAGILGQLSTRGIEVV